MGNCQAIDAATLVIQHPCGKSDKLYWPVPAAEVMKSNPGHYVALLISSTLCPPPGAAASSGSATAPEDQVRVTRIKLLRPTDTLLLGQVYRLITSKEVTKVLSAKKNAKMTMMMRKGHEIRVEQQARPNHPDHVRVKDNLVDKQERQRRQQKPTTTSTTTGGSNNSATGRSKTWQPSLKSISEAS
ncbi:hypothetical protein MLD38_031973 [Melastoma candidum]|uniref:Uncharacterized protein n=1 Tax=Melastoma candidum TaxID=119954 RepID=A0ACB9MUK8_9MYRT|nr:hypothetical protein MLD38_031973 [Melastoma candidum]